jgi:hypothetical protein
MADERLDLLLATATSLAEYSGRPMISSPNSPEAKWKTVRPMTL